MKENQIIEKYKEHILEEGKPPASVFRFAKSLDLSEREFFEHFASFEAIEAVIWKNLVTASVSAIRLGEEWDGFTAQQKLLTFYYAFFEKALDDRSFLLVRFPRCRGRQSPASQLQQMKLEFTAFARKIISEGTEKNEIACRGKLNDTYPSGMFRHFISAIEFNLDDTSQRFERTDAFIEKSVQLGFDLIGRNALESAFDLVRFLSGRRWCREGEQAP